MDTSSVSVEPRRARPTHTHASWKPVTTDTVTAEHLDALLRDEIPYIRVPKFFSADWCDEIARRFWAMMDQLPDNKTPIGPCVASMLIKPLDLFMHDADLSPYFDWAAKEAPRMREVFAGGDDPLDKIAALWERAGWKRVTAAHEGKPFEPDVIWSLESGPLQAPHVDTFQSDRVTDISRFDRRISYQVYLEIPEEGGEFAVFQRRKQGGFVKGPGGMKIPVLGPDKADDFRWAEDVGVVNNLLTQIPRADYELEKGDFILFDACNYHQVMGCKGIRTAAHANLAVDPDTKEFAFYV